MDIVVYRAGSRWATPWENAFIRGLKAHGVQCEQRPQTDRRVSDLAVIWAHRQTPLFELQREAGRHYLVMERGYIGDRYKWTSLGFDGLNGRATFPPARDDRRFDAHFSMRPWHAGDYALVLGQVPGDQSIRHMNIHGWVQTQINRLKAMGYVVRYRPHPLDYTGWWPDGAHASEGSLPGELAGAALAVTYNSNSGVDAVLHGTPTVAMDEGSMAWPVAAHELDEPAPRCDRAPWANQLAWNQWNAEEIERGDAWAHLSEWLLNA